MIIVVLIHKGPVEKIQNLSYPETLDISVFTTTSERKEFATKASQFAVINIGPHKRVLAAPGKNETHSSNLHTYIL
jgi:hypothetical protein